MADDGEPIFDAGALEHELHRDIPLTHAMRLKVAHLDADSIALSVPLAPNVNDKGTGFAGSVGAVLTLSGWCLLHVNARAKGIDCDIVIHRSEQHFHRPVRADFTAHCRLPEDWRWGERLQRLRQRGRARAALSAWVPGEDGTAASLYGQFVLLARDAKPTGKAST